MSDVKPLQDPVIPFDPSAHAASSPEEKTEATIGSLGGLKVTDETSEGTTTPPLPLKSALKGSNTSPSLTYLSSVASSGASSPFRSVTFAEDVKEASSPSPDSEIESSPSKEKDPMIQKFINRWIALPENKKIYSEKTREAIRSNKDAAGKAWIAAAFASDQEAPITQKAFHTLQRINKLTAKQIHQGISDGSLNISEEELPTAIKTAQEEAKSKSFPARVFSSTAEAAYDNTEAHVRLAEALEQDDLDTKILQSQVDQAKQRLDYWIATSSYTTKTVDLRKQATQETKNGNQAEAQRLTEQANHQQQIATLFSNAAKAFEQGDPVKAAKLEVQAIRMASLSSV